MKMLDLCSGLGGASEAFLLAGWDVQRIESNSILANIPQTTIIDVKTLRILLEQNPPGQIEFVWASPPCREFSNAFNSPKSQAVRAGQLDAYIPDMSIVMECIRIIEIVKPKYWCIENVRGATRYFNPILGEPRQVIGPYCLWGNFPYIDPKLSAFKTKAQKDVHSANPLRANLKALIPIEISQAFCNAISTQTSIFDYPNA